MDTPTWQTLTQLDELGKKQLNAGHWEEAAETFRKLLELDDHPVVRNNLATAYYNSGKVDEAWEVLAPELAKDVISPFAWALASMIACDQGRGLEAREYLERSIFLFERGVRDPRELGFKPEAWREYTVIIKRAAGHLGDHRLVLNLHKRWERYYQSPEDLFQVGVAFFNTHYPLRAVQVWSRIRERGWGFLEGFAITARLVDQGVVPHFLLPYSAPDFGPLAEPTVEEVRRKLEHGGNRALILANLFDPDFPRSMAQESVFRLVSLGEWGLAFGRSLLESSIPPMELKMAAGMALMEQGVLAPGEPVTMVIDGVERQVHLMSQRLAPASPEQKAELLEIQDLLLEGQCERARDLLVERFQAGNLSLEGCQLLAKAHGALGELEKALDIVYIFKRLGDQGNAWGYLVVADLYLYLGELDLAREYLELVPYSELSPTAKQRYREIEEYLKEE